MREFGYFALSLSLHGLVLFGLLSLIETDSDAKKDDVFQLTLQDPPKRSMQIISAPDNLPDQKINDKSRSRRLSDKKRRVELETMARPKAGGLRSQFGKNRPSADKKSRRKTQPKTKAETQANSEKLNDSLDGIRPKVRPNRVPLKLPYSRQTTNSAQYLPNYVQQSLPQGVQLGNITALNTDQHLFYNFHSRLLGRFVPLWGDMVSRSLYRWLRENKFPRVNRSWVTNVEVVLDAKGEVLDVQHLRLSGMWPFDEAPVKAFKKTKQIPNPPKEMVDENGYIRLKFQTEVHWVPQAAAKLGLGPGQRSN